MKFEELLNEVEENNINFYEYEMHSDIRGLCIGNNIVLNKELGSEREKSCILAEEIGHFKTTVGDITNDDGSADRKQEKKARGYAYDRLIGAEGFVRAWLAGNNLPAEVAEYLGVTESFLLDALEYYTGKYGEKWVYCDEYKIKFVPKLEISYIKEN